MSYDPSQDLDALTAQPDIPPVAGVTPDDIAALQAGLQGAGTALPPVVAPQVAPAVQQPVPMQQPASQGSSAGRSVSIQQQTPYGKQVTQSLGNMKGRTAEENKRYQAENAGWMGAINDAYNNESDATAQTMNAKADAEQANAGDVAGASKASVDASAKLGATPEQQAVIQSGGQAAQAIAQQLVFNTEDAAAKQSQALQMASRAKYEGSLAKLEAMQIDPNRLFRSGAVQWSSAIAAVAAASNKPGNLALSNQLMDSIKGAVQNDINGQIENLKNQKSVTEGFKTLWDMTAADSQSEAEARAKVEGAYYGIISSYMGAQGLQEQSKVTRASIAEAQAQLQVAKVTAAQSAYNELAKIHASRLNTISEDARTAAQVSVQRASVNEQARQFNATQVEKQKAAIQKMADEGIYATTPGGGNRYQGQVKGVTDEEKAKNHALIEQTQSAAATASETVQRAMDLSKLISEKSDEELVAMGFKGKIGAKTELQRQLDTLRTLGGTTIGKAIGLAPFSDTDRDTMSSAVADPAILANLLGDTNASSGSSNEVLSFIQRNADNQIKAYVRPGTDEEIQANKGIYGEQPFHDVNPRTGEDMGVPGTQRDYTQYQGNTMPDVKAQAEGALNPSPETHVDKLVAQVADDKALPSNGMVMKPKADLPSYYEPFKAYEKEQGWDKTGKLGTEWEGFADEGGKLAPVPESYGDIATLAKVAFKGDDSDQKHAAFAAIVDMSGNFDNEGRFCRFVLDHPEYFGGDANQVTTTTTGEGSYYK